MKRWPHLGGRRDSWSKFEVAARRWRGVLVARKDLDQETSGNHRIMTCTNNELNKATIKEETTVNRRDGGVREKFGGT